MSTSGSEPVVGAIRPHGSGASSPNQAGATRTPKLAGLIASRVYGALADPAGGRSGRAMADAVDLSAAAASHSGPRAAHGAIPFYTNPARSNEVATEIALGRTLDVRG